MASRAGKEHVSADWTWAVSKGALVVSRYRHLLPVMILYLVKRSRMSRDPHLRIVGLVLTGLKPPHKPWVSCRPSMYLQRLLLPPQAQFPSSTTIRKFACSYPCHGMFPAFDILFCPDQLTLLIVQRPLQFSKKEFKGCSSRSF